MELEVGKYYRTRGGSKAYIYFDTQTITGEASVETDYPLRGVLIENGCESELESWKSTGENIEVGYTHPDDIIAEWEDNPSPNSEVKTITINGKLYKLTPCDE